jgi:hypothetical protein
MPTAQKSPVQRSREYLLQHHAKLFEIGAFRKHLGAAYVHKLMCEMTQSRAPEDMTQLDDWVPRPPGINAIVRKLKSMDRRSVVREIDYLCDLRVISKGRNYNDLWFSQTDADSPAYGAMMDALEEDRQSQKRRRGKPKSRMARTVEVRGPAPQPLDVEFTG